MKGVRAHHRTLKLEAWCLDCERRWDEQNALAVAARHTAAFRHRTQARVVVEHAYVPESTPPW